MSRAELVKLWEDLIDNDPEAAEELFFASLLLDARAQYGGRRGGRNVHGQGQDVAVVGKDDGGEEEERRRRARVFRPWQPPPPASPLPPPPAVAAAPPVLRDVVLGLRAPPHLVARRHGRTTPSAAPAAGPERSWENHPSMSPMPSRR
ncbi:unnamed protein product [Urochloa humidicola]